MSIVQNVLKVDAANRTAGIEGDLHSLDDISQQDWDYSYPTLLENDDKYYRTKFIYTSSSFKKTFIKNHPLFEGFNFSNVLIAGGCVGHYLTSTNMFREDIDLFIYGLGPNTATKRLEMILRDLIETYQNQRLQGEIEFKQRRKEPWEHLTVDDLDLKDQISTYRTQNCITLNIGYNEEKIQIILRAYKTKSEILHGFDLGSSAVGFDGENVWLTTLGRFSYEYGANIVDTTRRSTTYEYRLEKYFGRNFSIIVPDLDMSKLPQKYFKYNMSEVCELPLMTFSYKDIQNNKIYVNRFLTHHKDRSDYDMEGNQYAFMYTNIIKLVNGRSDLIGLSQGPNLDILTNGPYISEGKIEWFYDDLEKRIFTKDVFNHGLVQRYINVDSFAQILLSVYNEDINTGEYIHDLIQRQKKIVKAKLQELNKDTSVKWRVDNPGSQLTGSFNPIIEDPEKWYGSYYNAGNATTK